MEVIEPIEIALDLWVLGLEVVFEEPCLCGVLGKADVADQVRDRQHEGRRVRFFHVHRAREYVFDFISTHLFTRDPAIIKSCIEPTINYPHA